MALPRVQPIIPTWRKRPFDHADWLFEVKYDGFRALCYVERGRARFVSRNGNLLRRFDALAGQIASVLEGSIDCEVFATDGSGRPPVLRPHPWHACSVATRAGAEVHRTIGLEAMLEVERRTVER